MEMLAMVRRVQVRRRRGQKALKVCDDWLQVQPGQRTALITKPTSRYLQDLLLPNTSLHPTTSLIEMLNILLMVPSPTNTTKLTNSSLQSSLYSSAIETAQSWKSLLP